MPDEILEEKLNQINKEEFTPKLSTFNTKSRIRLILFSLL